MHQPRPFRFGRMEEQFWFADGAGKVIGEGHGADFAVADLHPLVRKDEIRFVVRADVKRPVKALPIEGVTRPSLCGTNGPSGLSAVKIAVPRHRSSRLKLASMYSLPWYSCTSGAQ